MSTQAYPPTGAPPMPPPPPPLTVQQSVVIARPGVNHTFHLLMTVFTCGAWLPVWIAVIVIDAIRPRR